MRESVLKFGPNKSLLGILTEPAAAKLIEGSPVAVILNAGITHRVGPFRLHVHLSRALAAMGFRILRVDLSGLGDSRIRAGKLDTEQRTTADVKDAFAAIEAKLGIKQFVLIGLCSGAYNSHRVSVADERVVGAVFLDGIVFRTLGFYLRSATRLFKPRFWRNAVKRRLSASKVSPSQAEAKAMTEAAFFGEGLSRESTRQEIAMLVQRGVRMLFLYTAGYDDICGRAQFREMYGMEPNTDLLQAEYYKKSEHTYKLTANRQVAIERVANWFEAGFGAGRTTTELNATSPQESTPAMATN